MKLLFIHDHRLRKTNDNFYTTGGFSDAVTSRYTEVFDKMTLLCRASNNNDINGYVKIENNKLNICPIFENKSIPNKKTISIIKKEIEENDVIIVRLPSMLGLYGAKIALKLNKPLIIEVVGSAFGSYWYKSILGKFVSLPLELMNKHYIKKANYVLYVSEDYLQKKYLTNGISIGCSDVVLEQRNNMVLENRLKKINSYQDKNIVLGTLSQIDQKYKGHKTVFKVISRLKNEGYNIKYRLAGSGSKKYLEQLAKKYNIEECIEFNGQIKHENINEWIDSIDIYIQPSLTEGMPRSVIEVLYRGCPTIVSNAGGMYELIDKKYTFKKGNENSLYNILKTINSKKLYDMATNNFEFSKKFDYNTLHNKRRDFYKMIERSSSNVV